MRLCRPPFNVSANLLKSAASPLQTLPLSLKSLGPADLAVFPEVSLSGHLSGLVSLYLGGNPLGDKGAGSLAQAGAGMPLLIVISLPNTAISDSGMRHLVEASKAGAWPYLERLDLDSNHIGDGGVQALAEHTQHGFRQLQMLWLAHNRIGDPGVSHLASAIRKGVLPKIRLLDLGGNQASEAGRLHVDRAATGRDVRVRWG